MPTLKAGAPWQEMVLDEETPRAHWQAVWEHVQRSSYGALEREREAVRQRIAELEITYTTVGDGSANARHWQLDSLPLVIDAEEFEQLAAGMRQRANLLNCLLDDCYTSRSGIDAGLIPAQLVYGNPAFLRPCAGWRPAGQRLPLYAADLVRSPDGRWRVYADRTQAPIGDGYALENRLVLGRVLPELFRAAGTRRVAAFFGAVKRGLESLAPASENPRIVLLSAGPGDPSAYEHAYLARYLGYDLVEGSDLTVRGDRVFMKTLAGLERIDVILRRLGDDWCDSLELRGDSVLGVPGLLGAARAGGVAIANPVGSILAACPAFKSLLPQLCRNWLGKDLLLESTATLWCGTHEGLAFALEHLDDCVLKPTFPQGHPDPLVTCLLDTSQRENLRQQILDQPWAWCAEERVEASRAPVWSHGHLHERAVSLRLFAAWDGQDWVVMPGGLARTNADHNRYLMSLRHGGGSKDVWVLGAEPGADAPLPAMPTRASLRRGGVNLPSRLLDDIYWLGRYYERADGMARLLRLIPQGRLAEGDPSVLSAEDHLLNAACALAAHAGTEGESAEQRLASLVSGSEGGILATLARGHQLAARVRSRLSGDTWRIIGEIQQAAADLSHGVDPDRLTALILRLAALAGSVQENMVRSHVWTFLDLGRRCERAACLLQVLRHLLEDQPDRARLELLLAAADSAMTYRARYLSQMAIAPAVDLVLTDETNPRSVAYNLARMEDHLAALPGAGTWMPGSRPQRALLALTSRLRLLEIDSLAAENLPDLCTQLLAWVEQVEGINRDIDLAWFSHALPAHNLSSGRW